MDSLPFAHAGPALNLGATDLSASDFEVNDLRLRDEQVLEAPAENSGWRRFVATKPISDHDSVELLEPVRTSMRREQSYRRALAIADGFTALVVTLMTATVCGIPLSWVFLVVPIGAVLVSKVQGLYDRDDMVVRKTTVDEWRNVLRANVITAMAVYLAWWATVPSEGRGLRVFGFLVGGMFVLTLPARASARRAARELTPDERCLIVGSMDQWGPVARVLRQTPGLELIGAVSDSDVDCSVAGVCAIAEQLDVERLVVIPHAGWGERGSLKLVQSCKWLGVRVSLMLTDMTAVGSAGTLDQLDSTLLLGVPRFGLSRSSAALKRSFDLVGASVGIVCVAPLLALIALAVKLDSRGPALFKQTRVGRDGALFTMCKFRSMVVGAEQMKAGLGAENETNGLFKIAHDPRVTRVGRVLRASHLDELPQLVNVLRGQMSLVGPRPLIESEDRLLQGYDRHRSRLVPGMTGPWQLRGPIEAPLSELAKLDYIYASNWSIWSDIDILLGTFTRVLNRRGH